MKRLDWLLVRPSRDGGPGSERLAEQIDALVARATREVLTEGELELLLTLEEQQEAITISACEAVGAPRVEDNPDWEGHAIDEFAAGTFDMELEDFLSLRRQEPDCEQCPYASPYSLFPMDPCEFSAGPLLEIIDDAAIRTMTKSAMGPEGMCALADALEAARSNGTVRALASIDTDDYLKKAAFFLRFWAGHGFGIKPQEPAALGEIQTAEPPPGDPNDPNETPPLLH